MHTARALAVLFVVAAALPAAAAPRGEEPQRVVVDVQSKPPPAEEKGPGILEILGLVVGPAAAILAWALADSKGKGRAAASEAAIVEKLSDAKTETARVAAELRAVEERVRAVETVQASTTPKLDGLTETLRGKADNVAVEAVGKRVEELRTDVVDRLKSLEVLIASAVRDNMPKGGGRGGRSG